MAFYTMTAKAGKKRKTKAGVKRRVGLVVKQTSPAPLALKSGSCLLFVVTWLILLSLFELTVKGGRHKEEVFPGRRPPVGPDTKKGMIQMPPFSLAWCWCVRLFATAGADAG